MANETWYRPVEGVYRNHGMGCTDEYEHPGSCRYDDGQKRGSKAAYDLAAQLPVVGDLEGEELISLGDIVVTGIETDWIHFWVKDYAPFADGVVTPWATIWPLKDSAGEDGKLPEPVTLDENTVRKAVELYIDSRLSKGMEPGEVARLVDGSYTDAVVADSILQFALYGSEVYG